MIINLFEWILQINILPIKTIIFLLKGDCNCFVIFLYMSSSGGYILLQKLQSIKWRLLPRMYLRLLSYAMDFEAVVTIN